MVDFAFRLGVSAVPVDDLADVGQPDPGLFELIGTLYVDFAPTVFYILELKGASPMDGRLFRLAPPK